MNNTKIQLVKQITSKLDKRIVFYKSSFVPKTHKLEKSNLVKIKLCWIYKLMMTALCLCIILTLFWGSPGVVSRVVRNLTVICSI